VPLVPLRLIAGRATAPPPGPVVPPGTPATFRDALIGFWLANRDAHAAPPLYDGEAPARAAYTYAVLAEQATRPAGQTTKDDGWDDVYYRINVYGRDAAGGSSKEATRAAGAAAIALLAPLGRKVWLPFASGYQMAFARVGDLLVKTPDDPRRGDVFSWQRSLTYHARLGQP
jgi:hypothetical protein